MAAPYALPESYLQSIAAATPASGTGAGSGSVPINESSTALTPLVWVTPTASTPKQLIVASMACRGVFLACPTTNTAVVYFGDSTVDGTTKGIPIAAGGNAWLPIDNANKVYLWTTGTGQVVQPVVFN